MNEQRIAKLTNAISDLAIVEKLASKGRIEEAKQTHLNLYLYVSDIFGGNETVCQLMDEFSSKHNALYVELFS